MFGISGTSKYKEQKHRYYACSTQYNKHQCDKKYEKKDALETYVATETITWVLKPKIMERIATRLEQEFEKSINRTTIIDFEKRIQKVNTELDKCFDLFFKADSEELRKRMNEKSKELELVKKDLQFELSKLKNAVKIKHTKDDIVNHLKQFFKGDFETDKELQERIIFYLVNCVYVSDKHTIILYNILGDTTKGTEISFDELDALKEKAEPLNSANDTQTGVQISCDMVHQIE